MKNKAHWKRVDDQFTEKYPPRGSWRIMHSGTENGRDYYFTGYYSEKLRRCPVCGRFPVFTESVYDASPEDTKAKVFLGYCPTCCLRTKDPGTLKEAVYQWQDRKYSKDSLLVCHRPRLDSYGCRMLSQKVIKTVIDDSLFFAQKRQECQIGSESWESYGTELKKLEKFFRESVFMFEMDADGVISDIRRILYPTLEPKDRIRIPLHLHELYNGKEVEKECHPKNSKTQP